MSIQNTKDNFHFAYSVDNLKQLSQEIVQKALSLGATDCEASVSEGIGSTVTVRSQEVETIEYNHDKGLGITVYIGQRKAHASTSDLSPKAIEETIKASLNIAKLTAEDSFAGLPEQSDLLIDQSQHLDLDLYCPCELTVEDLIQQATLCEASALDYDKRIKNSEGATFNNHGGIFGVANSRGFVGGYASSSYSLSCSMIAEQDGDMQRDYWYSSRRHLGELHPAELIGKMAGERTVRRLGSKKLKTTQAPVLFDVTVASSLIGHFANAVSGGTLYRKASFLLDSLEQQIFNPCVNLEENPHLLRMFGTTYFDGEGVKTQRRNIVEKGVVKSYFLSTYSSKKLGMKSTGNAGGSHHMILHSTGQSYQELLKTMGTGLIVTELMGDGVNMITGDYSRGASGFWVENGEIAYPVQEITIAGNLKDIYKQILAIGNDVLVKGSRQTGSILIENMMIAGN